MVSKTSTCLFACVIVFFIQSNAAKSLVPRCDPCRIDDVEIEASGSAHSSQFVQPDGSVITHSKGTVYSSDGIKQTFHELKKEADRFIQTGHNNLAIPPHISTFSDIHSSLPSVPTGPFYDLPSHESFSQSYKDHGFEKKIIQSLAPSSNIQVDNFQAQNNVHTHSNSDVPCTICAIHSGASSGKSDATASYQTIVGTAPVSSDSSYSRYESSSQQKNSTRQTQPNLFVNSPKANTFTTNLVDLNSNYNQNGYGSKTQIDYQESGNGHYKSEERLPVTDYGLGPISSPSKVVLQVSGPSSAAHSTSYKAESTSHVEQTGGNARPVPVGVYVNQVESELAKQHQQNQQNQAHEFYSPVLYKGVPQSVPLESQQAGSQQSSHSYQYSSSSSSSSKTVSGGSNPVIVQSPPEKYISSGYNSGSSISGISHSQNPSEFYHNGVKIHGDSASIHDLRGDSNAETICTTNCQPCTTCTYVAAGAPVKKTYGVSTFHSSQSSTINGKTTENREAAVSVNDNGKVDAYHVKTPGK